jgi:hypothetical protein
MCEYRLPAMLIQVRYCLEQRNCTERYTYLYPIAAIFKMITYSPVPHKAGNTVMATRLLVLLRVVKAVRLVVQLSAWNTKHDGFTVHISKKRECCTGTWLAQSPKGKTVQDDMSICTECRDVIEFCKFTSGNDEENVCLIFFWQQQV